MILVIDIGNTNTVIGVFEGKKLIYNWRATTRKPISSDEFGMFLLDLFNYTKIKTKDIENIIISCVVPSIIYSIEHAIRKYFRKEPLTVGPGIKTGISVKTENPKEVGADRIVNAVAGFEKYGGPLIIIDLGTATTFCAISKEGEYLGGLITPGIKIATEALFEKTAKLPRIELTKPKKVIGKNTVDSMQSGIYYGYAGQMNHIIDNILKETRWSDVKVIATGGLASFIASESKRIDIVDRYLTLEGLRIIQERNS